MGHSALKAAVLSTLLIVCVNSQLQFQGSGLSDKRDQKTKAVKERDNSLYRQQVIIDLPDCRSEASHSCNCTKIQELMSAELLETNRKLQQLQTAVDDIAELLAKFPVPTTQQVPIATTKAPVPTTSVSIAEDCTELLARSDGAMESGVYMVQPPGYGTPLQVYCDMETDGGGWTVFQRRHDGSVDFYRNFNDYRQWFGNLEGEFWLGNDNLHRFTAEGAYELRVDMTDFQGDSAYAVYNTFRVGGLEDSYMLEVEDYSGNAGDSLSSSNYLPFSTRDRDQDTSSLNCAEYYKGAWWFDQCFKAHLNGEYIDGGSTNIKGIVWSAWKGLFVSLKSTEMKIRKKH